MIIDPYQTKIASSYKRDKIAAALNQEWIKRDDRSSDLMEVSEGGDDIPQFTQPMLFQPAASRIPLVAVDFRGMKGENGWMKEQRELLRLRATLTLYGARNEDLAIYYHPCAMVAYANLIAGIIAGRFGVNELLKIRIVIAAAAHYYNMTHAITEGAAYEESVQLMLTQTIVRHFGLPPEVVDNVLSELTAGQDMAALIINIKRVDGTDRTRDLSSGLLVNGANSLWMGVNASELTAVAVEHAPTFCALLHAALGEGSYSRGEMAKRLKYLSVVRKQSEAFRNLIRSIDSEYSDHG